MSNFAMRTANAALTFRTGGKTSTARVRVSHTAYSYGVNSTESHARLDRAFYPHRRSLGQFQITVDAIGYKEYRRFMNWLREYAHALFTGQISEQSGATTMEVNMPSRNFHMIGILTTGINDQDHVGSMVFSPVLSFMLIKDFNDPGTSISKIKNVSDFHAPRLDTKNTLAFFPVTVSSYKDADSAIYDLGDSGAPNLPTDPSDPVIGGPVRVQ